MPGEYLMETMLYLVGYPKSLVWTILANMHESHCETATAKDIAMSTASTSPAHSQQATASAAAPTAATPQWSYPQVANTVFVLSTLVYQHEQAATLSCNFPKVSQPDAQFIDLQVYNA